MPREDIGSGADVRDDMQAYGNNEPWASQSADREKYGSNFTGRASLHIKPLSLVNSSHSPSEVPLVPLGYAVKTNFATLLVRLDQPRIPCNFLFTEVGKLSFGTRAVRSRETPLPSCGQQSPQLPGCFYGVSDR